MSKPIFLIRTLLILIVFVLYGCADAPRDPVLNDVYEKIRVGMYIGEARDTNKAFTEYGWQELNAGFGLTHYVWTGENKQLTLVTDSWAKIVNKKLTDNN